MVVRFRPMPLLTLVALAALALLLLLGHWQYERYGEKRARAAAPVAEITVGPIDAVEPQGVAYLYGVADGVAGWRVLTPVRVGDARMFVDAAFAPGVAPPQLGDVGPPASIALGVTLRGVPVRPGEAPPFAGAADPARRAWFAADLAAMAESAGLAGATEPILLAAPYVGADGRSRPNPFGNVVDPLPPERHLGYALTWWGLAISLVAIYLALHGRAGRLALAAPRPRA